jgi:sigma-E factor negative regulatory protein RseA
MNDEIREQLSALVDDELDDAERPLLLGRLQRDPRLGTCLGRYQLIGEVMRGGDVEAASLGVADRVRRALEEDEPMHVPVYGRGKQQRWLKPLAGLAVAASVALVAVLAVTSVRTGDNSAQVPELASVQQPVIPAASVARVGDSTDEQWDRLDPLIEKRLSGYLVNHNEYAASRGVQGVMPYVRIVGYDPSE